LEIVEASQSDDEIDLVELLAAIWANKSLVIGCTGIGVLLSIIYVLFIATPTYEAANRFELNEPKRESFGDFGGLASLAGIGVDRGGASEAEKLQDRIFSRRFLSQISEPAALYEDPVFNAALRSPGLKEQAFDLIGLGSDEAPTQARIDAAVARHFEDKVLLTVKDNGVLEVTVTHPDPDRAASIANIVVSQALQNLYEMQRKQADEKLEYFAEQLFEAREDLDMSTQALQDYSLENTLLSQEELARSSSQLGSLRDRRETVRQRRRALDQLADIARNENKFDAGVREAFLENYPTASSLEFRRLLGWTSSEGSWRLPTPENIVMLRQSLNDQEATLDRAIRNLEKDAEQSAVSATELERLRREIAVNEAIYQAMLKQFEGEALQSGFSVESGEIIDMAVSPVEPSAPRSALVAALGLILGAFLGIALALLWTMRRGVLHTKGALYAALPIQQMTTLHRALARQPVRNFMRALQAFRGKYMSAVEDLLVQISPGTPSRIAVIASATGRLTTNVSLAISRLQRVSSDSLCLVDLTDNGGLVRTLGVRRAADNPTELEPGLFVVQPSLGDGQSPSCAVSDALDALSAQFDKLVIVCPPPELGTAVSQKAVNHASMVVIIAQSGHTTRLALEKVKAVLSNSPNAPTGLMVA
jgi:uncharacterized protein involved in exopolysaccharide biosynthesis